MQQNINTNNANEPYIDANFERLLHKLSMDDSQTEHIPAEPFTSNLMMRVQAEAQATQARQKWLNRILALSAPMGIAVAFAFMGESGVGRLINDLSGSGNEVGPHSWLTPAAWLIAQASAIALVLQADR